MKSLFFENKFIFISSGDFDYNIVFKIIFLFINDNKL